MMAPAHKFRDLIPAAVFFFRAAELYAFQRVDKKIVHTIQRLPISSVRGSH